MPGPVGRWVMICGRLVSNVEPVENVLEKSSSGLPARLVTSPVATTVISVSNGSVAVRNTVRLSLERVMLVDSSLPAANNANELLVIVVGSSDSENVSVTTACGPTPVAPSAGVTIRIVGAVVSAAAAVVNVADVLWSALPATSVTWPL